MDQSLIQAVEEFKSTKKRILGRLLKRSYAYITALSAEFLKQEGYDNFRVAHVVILLHVDKDKGLMINDLAQQVGITKQAISKVIKELAEEGYVVAEKHPTDARASLTRLTDKGARFLLAWQRCTEYVDETFKDIIGSKRLEQLKDILEEIADHYEVNGCATDTDMMLLKKFTSSNAKS